MASWGSCDFKQLQQLQKGVEKLAQTDMDTFCKDCARGLATHLLSLVIPRTPVGVKPTLAQIGGEGAKKTYRVKGSSGKMRSMVSREAEILHTYWSAYMGGSLRRGWTSKEGEKAGSKGVQTSAAEIAAFVKSLEVFKSGDSYQIIVRNPVEYASYAEFGHVQIPGRYVPQIGKRLTRAYSPGKRFLTIAEAQLQSWIPSYLEKQLQARLAEVFKDG